MSIEDSNDFERCPHDKENPYAQISRELIRDESISPECRWLVIYLLSMKDGWKVKASQIINHVQKHMGRDKVYKVLQEAIDSGYIRREITKDRVVNELKEKNLNRYKYYVSEKPKIQKGLRLPENQDTENQDPENTHTKERASSSIEEKEEHVKDGPTSSPPSAEASLLTDFFLQKIKERLPGFKQPDMKKWAQEMDRLLRLDGRNVGEVQQVIVWASDDKWFKANCLSPSNLRKNYDRMVSQMMGDAEQNLVRENRNWALKAKEKYPKQLKYLSFDDKYVLNVLKGKEIRLNMQKEAFREACVTLFEGRNED